MHSIRYGRDPLYRKSAKSRSANPCFCRYMGPGASREKHSHTTMASAKMFGDNRGWNFRRVWIHHRGRRKPHVHLRLMNTHAFILVAHGVLVLVSLQRCAIIFSFLTLPVCFETPSSTPGPVPDSCFETTAPPSLHRLLLSRSMRCNKTHRSSSPFRL